MDPNAAQAARIVDRQTQKSNIVNPLRRISTERISGLRHRERR